MPRASLLDFLQQSMGLLHHSISQAVLILLERLTDLIVRKLPSNKIFWNHAMSILSIPVHVLIEDYEENAILANTAHVKALKGCKSL